METKIENKVSNRMFDHCKTDRCEECVDKKRCCAEAWKAY